MALRAVLQVIGIARTPTGNHILDALPDSEAAPLRAALEPVAFKVHDILYPSGEPIHSVVFPTTAVLSVLTVMQDGSAVEIGTFGCEGISAAQLVLGADRWPSQVICQVPGDAYRLPVAVFHEHIDGLPTFRRLVRRYAEALFNFMGQSIACNRLHSVNERCARWLLLTHDRVAGDAFELTQEFLAIMLGVQRPVVSIAAGALADLGAIRYRRGRVEILDRPGLEAAACECYRINADEFARVR